MSQPTARALLPAGMADGLPPHAAFEAATAERLMALFAGYGYQRVKPPLLEFEDNLLTGSGMAMAETSFRVMDPASHRMLALRPDMTLQVARIAQTRLARRPRPLRLAYAGQVVRVRGSQMRPERQFAQAGAEVVGAPFPAADAEVVLMAARALSELGVRDLSVDLGQPTLVPALLADHGLAEPAARAVRDALDRKDAAAIRDLAPDIGAETAATLTALLAATGPSAAALAALDRLVLPPSAAAERDALAAMAETVRQGDPTLTLTVDPVENRGFEYHTGVTFTLFGRKVRGELGRGGRYRADNGSDGEPATGVTLFLDSVLRALPPGDEPARVLLAPGTPPEAADRLRRDGWIAMAAMVPVADLAAEAARQGCTHVFDGDAPRPIGGGTN